MPKYLVTGAAGFIGRSIAKALLDRNESVRGVDNFSTGRRENLTGLSGLEFVEGDLSDPAVCVRVCRDVSIVFHQAALPSVPLSVADPVRTNMHCTIAALNLLVAARDAGVRRVVYAGSSSAYGDNPSLPKREDMLPEPISPYAAAKLAGEHYMTAFSRVYGLDTVVLRYFNVFGPFQDPQSPYSGVLAIFCQKLLAHQQPTIFGDGEQSRDFTFIDDVVEANLLAAHAPREMVASRVINAATGTEKTLNETFRLLKAFTGFAGEPAYAPARAGDVRKSVADLRLARELLGYTPKVKFANGLYRTLQWYREHSNKRPAKMGPTEFETRELLQSR